MSYRYFLPILLSAAALGAPCVPAYSESPSTDKLEEGMKKVIEGENDFTFALYSTVNPENNFVFSPYSVHTCMSMVYVGAKGNTATELKKALRIPLSQSTLPQVEGKLAKSLVMSTPNAYQLNIANAMWLDQDTFVLSDFRHAIQDDFQAKLQVLDFFQTEKAISIINEWTANQTQNKITDLLHPGDVDSSTRVVLTNAVYFQGTWERPFDVKNTKPSSFYPTPDSPMMTPMMEQTAAFSYTEDDDMQLLSIPVSGRNEQGPKMACLFLLPKKANGLQGIESSLNLSTFRSWLSSLDEETVHVKLPLFSFKGRLDLNSALTSLGIKDAFSPKADLSGIDGLKDLFLSKVIHEAFFAIDEAGVTAAAATAASINMLAVLPKEPIYSFNANHPFLFFIADMQNKTILFMGKLTKPMVPNAASEE